MMRAVADRRRVALGVVVQPDEPGGRHRRHRGQLGLELEQRSDQLAAALLVAHVGDLDDHDVAAAQRLGDDLDRWQLEDAADRGDLVGRRLGPVAPGLEHLARSCSQGQISQPAKTVSSGKSLYSKRRDDAEVAAAAAQREEEVALVRVVDAVELAVGRDELDRREGVRGEAVLAGQPAHAAAERVAGDADVRRGAVQDGEAVLGRGVDDVLPDRARADAGLLRLDVDLDVAQLGACARARHRRGRRARRRRDRCPAAPRAGRWPWRSARPPARRRSWRGRRSARAAGRRRRSKACAPRPSPRRRGRARNRGSHDAEPRHQRSRWSGL